MKGKGSLGTGVTESCELPFWVLGIESRSSGEQPVLLPTESSLQTQEGPKLN